MIDKLRRQFTLRVPMRLWSWLRMYHRRRRDEYEQREAAGLQPEKLRVTMHDTLLSALEEGLLSVCPLASVDMNEVLGAPSASKDNEPQ